MRRGIPQRDRRPCALLAHDVQRLRADAARGQVHHALERGVVVAIGDQPQIGQRVLDLGALVEPQAAVHPVGNPRRQERFFERARLRVGAVQDRDFAPRAAVARPVADALHDEVRFVALVERGVEPDRLALARRSVHRFLPSRPVLCAISALAAARMLPVER